MNLKGIKWLRTGRRPCPVCGSKSWCSFVEKAGEAAIVKCMRRGDSSLAPGLSLVPHSRGRRLDRNGAEYFIWAVDGESLPELSPEEIARREKKHQEKRAEDIERARRTWKSSSVVEDGSAVLAYLASRGLKLPRVPPCLRFKPNAMDFPAAGCNAKTKSGKDCYIGPAMVASIVNEAGAVEGVHLTFLGPDHTKRAMEPFGEAKKVNGARRQRSIRLSEHYAGGVLLLAEGIETALACILATRRPAWSVICDSGLYTLRLPESVVGTSEKPGPVREIVIAADLDKSRAGEKAADLALAMFRRDYPWLSVRAVMPSVQDAPMLFEDGAPRGKGVDWLDVYNAAGPAAVARGLGLDPPGSVGAPPIDSGGGDGAEPPVVAAGEGSFDEGPLGHVPRVLVGGMAWANDDGRTVISPDGIDRARLYLLARHYAAGERVWRLQRWAGRWYIWAEWRWVAIEEEQLRHEVACWLKQFRTVRSGGRHGKDFMLDPDSSDIGQVLEYLAGECYLSAREVPVWIHPQIEGGSPRWGRAVRTWEIGDAAESRDGVRAKDLLPFRQGVIDTGALRSGRVVLNGHTPELFCTTARPYPIDLEMLRDVVSRDSLTWRGEDYARACPLWGRFLADITANDDEPTRTARLALLQEMLGDAISIDRSIEKIMMLVGPGRSGKTLVEMVVTALAGVDSVAATSFEQLVQSFGLAPLLGKSVAIMGDAHLPDMMTGSKSLTPLKTISGNGAVQVRDLYSKAMPRVVLGCRFWIIMNDEPDKIRDNSGVIVDRLVIFAFNRSFLGKEDPKLKTKIPAEAPGIAAWALCGYLRTWSKSQPTIESVARGREIQAELKRIASPLNDFVAQCLDFEPASGVTLSDLYGAYVRWCKARGKDSPVSDNVFGLRLMSVVASMAPGVRRQASNTHNTRDDRFDGFTLRPEWAPSQSEPWVPS